METDQKKKEAPDTASRPEGFSFVGRSFAVLGFPPDLRLASRLTFLQAAYSAPLLTQSSRGSDIRSSELRRVRRRPTTPPSAHRAPIPRHASTAATSRPVEHVPRIA